MPKRIKLRTLTTEEEREIRRLAKSRKESIRLVQRARVIEAMLDDPGLAAYRAGEQVGFKGPSQGIHWVRGFNEKGMAGHYRAFAEALGRETGRAPVCLTIDEELLCLHAPAGTA